MQPQQYHTKTNKTIDSHVFTDQFILERIPPFYCSMNRIRVNERDLLLRPYFHQPRTLVRTIGKW